MIKRNKKNEDKNGKGQEEEEETSLTIEGRELEEGQEFQY